MDLMRELKLGERHYFSLVVLVSTMRFCPLGLYFLEISQDGNIAAVPFEYGALRVAELRTNQGKLLALYVSISRHARLIFLL